MSLEYRPIVVADHARYIAQRCEAFGGAPDETRDWMSRLPEMQLRGLFKAGDLVAQTAMHLFQISDGRGALGTGGFDSIVTPPQHRRRGYTAELLRRCVAELLERGIFLSTLGSFKMSFYRKLGWATFTERRKVIAPIAALMPFRREVSGAFSPATEADIPALHEIFLGGLRGRFGPIIRTPGWWRTELLRLDRSERHSFIWRGDDGRARAYVIYQWRTIEGENVMACREAITLDPQARAQLFAFMADHDSQTDTVHFFAPMEAPISALLHEAPEYRLDQDLMLRLLDVAQALAAFHYPPEAAGRLTLEVTDAWLPHNQGVFALEVQNGVGQVTRLADDTPGEIAVDVAVLAQIYSRFLRPRAAATFGLIEVRERAALRLLDALFAGLAPFNSDEF
jgi:predicted acetyltransferase